MKVYFATRLRGFFKHLFTHKDLRITLSNSLNNTYELNPKTHMLMSKLVRSRLADLLGIVQIIRCKYPDCDIIGSYNRFIKSDKPYFIYVENPTALYHYKLERNAGLGKVRIAKALNDPNLKALVFMSKACEETFESLCGCPHSKCMKKLIYPCVPENTLIDNSLIRKRSQNTTINLLFIAQGLRFISKGGMDVVEAYRRLIKNNISVNLQIVTSFDDLDTKILKFLKSQDDIKLHDFKLTYKEMQELYKESNILLHPSSDDSSPLTVLEAIKNGLPVISTKLYAIPEYIEDGYNGFLTDPKYFFFTRDNYPNSLVWNNRRATIHNIKTSERIVNFLCKKIKLFCDDRDVLFSMSVNSIEKSRRAPLSESYIVKQWNDLFEDILKNK